ncbi:MAG: hypothetical protein ACK2U6_00330 [Candidatus Promineifilaceae bacterium]
MSIPARIVITISSYAFTKFLDRYGEDILEYATSRGEEFVQDYGPQAVRWTAETSSKAYEKVAPLAAGAVSRLAVLAGRPSKGAVIPGVDEAEENRLSTMLLGPYAGDLGRIGAYVRSAAQMGAQQLRSLDDEQIGAIAVALWRMQNRDSFIGRRVRKAFWSK